MRELEHFRKAFRPRHSWRQRLLTGDPQHLQFLRQTPRMGELHEPQDSASPSLLLSTSRRRGIRLPGQPRDFAAKQTSSSASVSNSLSGRHWELDQGPAVGDRTDIVQLGTGHHVSAGEGQRRVALQRRVAAYLVV